MSIYQKYKAHYKDNLKLAIPVVFSQFGQVFVQAADAIIIGHFAGTVSLAAVSLATSIFSLVLVIGIGISYGITPLIAQHNGKEEYAECGRLLSSSLFINIITGLVLFAFTLCAAFFLLNHLHQSQEVADEAKPFMILLGVSVIPMLIFNTFKQFTEGLGFTLQAMIISIAGNIFNILVGITLVKGLFGIAPMGIRGVGFSTLADRCIMALVMSWFVFNSKHFKKYLAAFSIKRISKSRCAKILKIGGHVAMQYVFEISAFTAAAVMIGSIDYHAQAAHQVAINMAAMTYMMASGLSAAAAIKSGNYFSGKDHVKLKDSAIASYHIVLVFMSCTALIFAVFNHWLPWIYTSDKVVIAIAAQLLIIAALFQLFDGTQVVGLGILRGMGDVNIPTLITFLAYWVVGLPVAYVLGIKLGFGAKGVWYGLVLGLMASSLLLFFRFRHMSKRLGLPASVAKIV